MSNQPDPRNDISFILGEIYSDVKSIKESLKAYNEDIRDLQDRVTKVEGWRREVIAYGLAITFVFSALWAVTGDLIKDAIKPEPPVAEKARA